MIGKFLFKVLGMSEKADFIVNVLTDWPAIKVGAYVAISAALLSAVGTVAGVYLGIKLSMKSFYSQKWWEKKADIYLSLYQSMNQLHASMNRYLKQETLYDPDGENFDPLSYDHETGLISPEDLRSDEAEYVAAQTEVKRKMDMYLSEVEELSIKTTDLFNENEVIFFNFDKKISNYFKSYRGYADIARQPVFMEKITETKKIIDLLKLAIKSDLKIDTI